MAHGKATLVACRDAGISQQQPRNELLKGRILYSQKEARIVTYTIAKALPHSKAPLLARIPLLPERICSETPQTSIT
jgi:hypothetical protein